MVCSLLVVMKFWLDKSNNKGAYIMVSAYLLDMTKWWNGLKTDSQMD